MHQPFHRNHLPPEITAPIFHRNITSFKNICTLTAGPHSVPHIYGTGLSDWVLSRNSCFIISHQPGWSQCFCSLCASGGVLEHPLGWCSETFRKIDAFFFFFLEVARKRWLNENSLFFKYTYTRWREKRNLTFGTGIWSWPGVHGSFYLSRLWFPF